MRKFLIVLLIMISTSMSAYAAKVPNEIKTYVNKEFPNTNFRFDGVIILPDNTIYLPLFPAKIITTPVLSIKSTYPENKKLSDKPNVVIFNSEFVLMKVITDANGKKTIFRMANPPQEIRSALLPQDMLVPRGLIIPDNLKGIIGNLDIKMSEDPDLKVQAAKPKAGSTPSNLNALLNIPQLKDKTFYIATCYNKNIQVVNQGSKTPEYALAQKHVPISMRAYDDKFLLVTSYEKPSMDVISLQDDQVIKQIHFKSQPDEIIIDNNKKVAYVSCSEDSSIYMVNLESMTLMKQIKISGMCEKLTLSDDGTKLFYFDKKSRDIWAIELDNNYLLRDIGKFPNVSKIAYANDKIYIASRTKNRLAIIDYATIGLIAEIEVSDKPVDMIAYGDNLFVLGASENTVQVLDLKTDMITNTIYLCTNGFSTKIYRIEGTSIALITDTKAAMYSVFDLANKRIIKTNPLDTPVSSIVVTDKVKKINK